MKKRMLPCIGLLLLFSIAAESQIFTGGGGRIFNNGYDTSFFTINISGLVPSTIDSTFGLVGVCININHPAVQDLYVYLESPNKERVELSEGQSCTGTNYTNTCFNTNTDSSVTIARAPFTGTYRPVGYLGRFNTGQMGNGVWRLVIFDAVPFADSGSVIGWNITFGNNPPKPVQFTSSNLPIVIINTNDQPIGDSSLNARMGIIYNGVGVRNTLSESWNNYSGYITIHLHGNSTRYLEKQSFEIKTTDSLGNQLDAPLLGMPSDHSWDMIAPYQDKTLLRDPMTYQLYEQMGHYSSRLINVEVLMNNEYRGVYVFQEKLSQGKSRINVAKMTSSDNTVPAVSGGYIFQINGPGAPGTGWYSLFPGDSTPRDHFFYSYEYPKSTDLTSIQQTYIQNFLDTFETVMNSDSYSSPLSGYSKYIDISSFVDFFIVNEMSKNADAYRLSTYLYKDNSTDGGLLHIGPVWDYNIAWHNCNYGNSFSPVGWQYLLNDTTFPNPDWWAHFMLDSNFVNRLACRWTDLRQGILSNSHLNNYIDSTVAALAQAEVRNFIQWPILGAYIWPNPQNEVGATYTSELNDLKTWISKRFAWIDSTLSIIKSPCIISGIKEITPASAFEIYPNPVSSTLSVNYEINAPSKVKMELFNAMGVSISRIMEENRIPGLYHEEIPTGNLSAGIYSICLTVNNTVSYKKLIKIS